MSSNTKTASASWNYENCKQVYMAVCVSVDTYRLLKMYTISQMRITVGLKPEVVYLHFLYQFKLPIPHKHIHERNQGKAITSHKVAPYFEKHCLHNL